MTGAPSMQRKNIFIFISFLLVTNVQNKYSVLSFAIFEIRFVPVNRCNTTKCSYKTFWQTSGPSRDKYVWKKFCFLTRTDKNYQQKNSMGSKTVLLLKMLYDFNHLDFFLWRYIEGLVCQNPVESEENLNAKILAIQETPDISDKVKQSIVHQVNLCN